jgi:uncharacterized protein (TIGR00369 family)
VRGGDVLEGYLAAMLHDTVGPAVLATLEPGQFIITLDLQANFLRSAYPDRLVGRGSVVRRNADMAYVEGSLYDATGALVATGSSRMRVVDFADSAGGD